MLRTVLNSHLKIIGLSALILALVVAALALGGSARKSSPLAEGVAPQTSIPSFTLTTSRTITPANARERLMTTTQRFQRSDGIYKLVQTFYAPDGTAKQSQTYFGFINLGVFRVDESNKRLVFTGPLIDDRPANVEQFLRNHEQFIREESIAGVTVMVWRQADADPEEFREEYRAPSLGGLLIKTVKVSAGERETTEPTSIQMGEPPPNLFDELLSYRADYSSYERRVEQAEKKNDREMALLMRQLLERMRTARP
jgi:hypothetical protein